MIRRSYVFREFVALSGVILASSSAVWAVGKRRSRNSSLNVRAFPMRRRNGRPSKNASVSDSPGMCSKRNWFAVSMIKLLISSKSNSATSKRVGEPGASAGAIGGEAEGAEMSPKSAGQSAGLSDSRPSREIRILPGAYFGRVLVSKLFFFFAL